MAFWPLTLSEDGQLDSLSKSLNNLVSKLGNQKAKRQNTVFTILIPKCSTCPSMSPYFSSKAMVFINASFFHYNDVMDKASNRDLTYLMTRSLCYVRTHKNNGVKEFGPPQSQIKYRTYPFTCCYTTFRTLLFSQFIFIYFYFHSQGQLIYPCCFKCYFWEGNSF